MRCQDPTLLGSASFRTGGSGDRDPPSPAGTLVSGIIATALIVPVFAYRCWVRDKGRFSPQMLDDLIVAGGGRDLEHPKAGKLPDAGGARQPAGGGPRRAAWP